MHPRSIALPTLEEVRRELPALLAASGELSPRPFPDGGPPRALAVVPELSPAFDNVELDPAIASASEVERAFLERQIERTRRDFHRVDASSRWPWVLTELSVAPLADASWRDHDDAFGLLHLEVPLFTADRGRAVLRGQRHGLEDFEHWLTRIGGRWTSI